MNTTKPSLTPNEDAARASGVPDAVVAMMALPGLAGVRARIMSALSDAYTIAVMAEIDRGTPLIDVFEGTKTAVANVAVAAAMNMATDGHGMTVIVNLLEYAKVEAVAALASGIPESHMRNVPITNIVRA